MAISETPINEEIIKEIFYLQDLVHEVKQK